MRNQPAAGCPSGLVSIVQGRSNVCGCQGFGQNITNNQCECPTGTSLYDFPNNRTVQGVKKVCKCKPGSFKHITNRNTGQFECVSSCTGNKKKMLDSLMGDSCVY